MSQSLNNQLNVEIHLRNIPSQRMMSICTKRQHLLHVLAVSIESSALYCGPTDVAFQYQDTGVDVGPVCKIHDEKNLA